MTIETTYNIEFADNGMIARSFDSVTVTEGNERRMSEEIGKLVYNKIEDFRTECFENCEGVPRKIKITIKVEKE